jgi:heterodisulfide reductase subunit A-like polyferredoxin
MAGIGIFVCDCDGQISERIDLATLGNKLQEHPDVVEVISHTHLCSEAGLDLIEEALAGKGLGAVLVAACAQDLYEVTFRPVLARADLGPGQTVNLDLRVSSSRDEDVNARTTHSVDHALALLGRLEIPTDEFGLESSGARSLSGVASAASRPLSTSPIRATRWSWSSASRRSAAT